MTAFPSEFEHHADSVAEIAATLQAMGADKAVLKVPIQTHNIQ
jgi:hypothetical protein